jgi:hypothetical protein
MDPKVHQLAVQDEAQRAGFVGREDAPRFEGLLEAAPYRGRPAGDRLDGLRLGGITSTAIESVSCWASIPT